MSRARAIALGAGAALLVAGCASQPPGSGTAGGGYYENDGPPSNADIDLSAIPNAEPKNEPLSKYGNPDSYTALGQTYYVLKSAAGFTQTGMASWYGRQFDGQRTSSGEPYSMFKMTAAHKRLPIPCYVQVTNLDNGRQVIVRINDRGPFHKGRIIDLSYVAARRLGIVATGSAPVRIRTVTPDTQLAQQDSDDEPPTPETPPRDAPASADAVHTSRGAADNTGAGPVAPAHAAPSSVAQAQPHAPARGDLFLQTGAFGNPDNARRLRARLKAAGAAQITILKPTAATPLYRVQVGPFADTAGRASARQILAARGFPVRAVER